MHINRICIELTTTKISLTRSTVAELMNISRPSFNLYLNAVISIMIAPNASLRTESVQKSVERDKKATVSADFPSRKGN